MHRVVLNGYYGFNNAGDDAILEAIIDALASESALARVPLHVDVITKEPYAHLELRHEISITYIRRSDWKQVVRSIKLCDAFISGGGSLFQDISSWRSIIYYAGLAQFANRYKKPIYIYSQGIGPIRREWLAKLVQHTMKQASYISVRDLASYQWITSRLNQQVDIVADPVFGYPHQFADTSENTTRDTIGLALREWQDVSKYDWSESLIEAVELVHERLPHMKFELLTCHEPTDRIYANKVMNRIRERAPYLPITLAPSLFLTSDTMHRISSYCLLVGMRLHALIFAAVQQVPVVAISYDPKVDQLMANLGRQCSGATTELYAKRLADDIIEIIKQRQHFVQDQNEKVHVMKQSINQPAKRIVQSMASHDKPSVKVFDFAISNRSMSSVVEELIVRLTNRTMTHVVTINALMVMEANRNSMGHVAIREAEFIVPDGIGIVWASNKFGQKLQSRIPGIELMNELLIQANIRKCRVYLLGASPEVIQATCIKIGIDYPNLTICGAHHGYFSADEDEQVVTEIRNSEADLLFVARTFEGQEIWLHRYKSKLGVPIMMGVGGSFDVIAGKYNRTPKWLIQFHLEWLYRMFQQPKKLKKIADIPRFIYKTYRW